MKIFNLTPSYWNVRTLETVRRRNRSGCNFRDFLRHLPGLLVETHAEKAHVALRLAELNTVIPDVSVLAVAQQLEGRLHRHLALSSVPPPAAVVVVVTQRLQLRLRVRPLFLAPGGRRRVIPEVRVPRQN